MKKKIYQVQHYINAQGEVFALCVASQLPRERSGLVVECLTRDRRAAGSSLTGVTAL